MKRFFRTVLWSNVVSTVALAAIVSAGVLTAIVIPAVHAQNAKTHSDAQPSELKRVLDRIMAPPKIHTEPGFTARLLIGPGESKLYDPLFMHDHEGKVLINDDGGQEGNKGGQILAIDRQGKTSDVLRIGHLLPVTGFDIAPASFGRYGGQLFILTQPAVTYSGAEKNHLVHRIDLKTAPTAPILFCTLPRTVTGKQGIPGWGLEVRFGPKDTPFAGKLFAVTALNHTVYQAMPDGRCIPFVTLDPHWGMPQGLAFSADGQHLLVSTFSIEGPGAIMQVRADGTVEPEPLVREKHLTILGGMAYAPASFGAYAGQLFFVAIRQGKEEQQQTRAPPATGEVYRLTPAKELKRVAAGLRAPQGVHFVDGRLWVSDVNGDFIEGLRRELPDGFIVEITPTG